MKLIIKYLLVTITLISFIFTNFLANADYEKPIAPSELNLNTITLVNNILDKIYNKKNNLSKYPTNQNYISYLNRVSTALNNLKNTFSYSDSRNILITYINSGINNIKLSIQNNSNIIENTQIANCEGKPANSVYNTVKSITQTWNATAWVPSTTSTYNTIASSTSCRYKCNTNYTWNGTTGTCDLQLQNCQEGFIRFPNNPNYCYDTRNCSSWNGYNCMGTSGTPNCPTGYHIVTGKNYCTIDILENNVLGTINSCNTYPSYLTTANATFIIGTPSGANQSWQNSSSSTPCYYSCRNGFVGAQCLPSLSQIAPQLTLNINNSSNSIYAVAGAPLIGTYVSNVDVIDCRAGPGFAQYQPNTTLTPTSKREGIINNALAQYNWNSISSQDYTYSMTCKTSDGLLINSNHINVNVCKSGFQNIGGNCVPISNNSQIYEPVPVFTITNTSGNDSSKNGKICYIQAGKDTCNITIYYTAENIDSIKWSRTSGGIIPNDSDFKYNLAPQSSPSGTVFAISNGLQRLSFKVTKQGAATSTIITNSEFTGICINSTWNGTKCE